MALSVGCFDPFPQDGIDSVARQYVRSQRTLEKNSKHYPLSLSGHGFSFSNQAFQAPHASKYMCKHVKKLCRVKIAFDSILPSRYAFLKQDLYPLSYQREGLECLSTNGASEAISISCTRQSCREPK